jgi:ADP-ribosyl-[dinitrogen reductase] hydrolase
MVQSALLGGQLSDLKRLADDLVVQEPQYRYDRRRMENPGGYMVETIKAVFQSLFATDSFEGALIDVVNRGGDADTTGAILGMIVGAFYGPEAIPRRWLANLDKQVAAHCRAQALALLAMSPHCSG